MSKSVTNPFIDKTVLVTGGAKRIGREIVREFASHGAAVVIHYNKSQNAADELAQEIISNGGKAHTVQADLTELASLSKVFKLPSGFSQINTLVNNASIYSVESLLDLEEESLLKNFKLHAIAPLFLSRELARQTKSGVIINLLDARHKESRSQHAAYHLSKNSLGDITKMLAAELAPNFRVNAIAAGAILPEENLSNNQIDLAASATLLKTWGSPKDISSAVYFLASQKFITGEILYIDGGRQIKRDFLKEK